MRQIAGNDLSKPRGVCVNGSMDNIAEAVLVVLPDGCIAMANRTALDMLGQDTVVQGANIAAFLEPGDGQGALDFVRGLVGRQANASLCVAAEQTVDVCCTVHTLSRFGGDPGAAGESYVLLAKDVSEWNRAQEELEELASLTDENPSIVMRVSGDMNLLYLNPAALEFAGALGLSSGAILPESLAWPARSALETGERQHVEESIGSKVHDLTFVPFQDKGYVNIYGVDASKRVEAETQLVQNAFYDDLTKLPNRALLKDHIQLAIRTNERNENRRFALLSINLDRFKYVNETYGHGVGDQLLVHCAQVLGMCFRAKDTIARFGSDLFCVLQSDVEDTGSLLASVRRVMEAFEDTIVIDQFELHVSVSMGIVLSDQSHKDVEAVIRDADTALYRAKSTGRGKYVIFDASMHQRMRRMLELEAKLRRAVENNSFEMFYQPKVSARTGDLLGFEALIRWTDAEEGFISPAEFIPVAEETGLILPLSDWILRDVCRQIAEWRKVTDRVVPVAVNCSGKQFVQKDFVARFKVALDEYDVPCELIEAEITESSLVDDLELVVEKLQALAEMGVKTSIDDFGTGYSSLTYLKMFPLHTLKVDRSFIKDMHVDKDDLQITGTIIAMAHGLGMEVVAEGVENEKQLGMLLEMSCEQIQGYYFSPPVAAKSALKMILSGVAHCAM